MTNSFLTFAKFVNEHITFNDEHEGKYRYNHIAEVLSKAWDNGYFDNFEIAELRGSFSKHYKGNDIDLLLSYNGSAKDAEDETFKLISYIQENFKLNNRLKVDCFIVVKQWWKSGKDKDYLVSRYLDDEKDIDRVKYLIYSQGGGYGFARGYWFKEIENGIPLSKVVKPREYFDHLRHEANDRKYASMIAFDDTDFLIDTGNLTPRDNTLNYNKHWVSFHDQDDTNNYIKFEYSKDGLRFWNDEDLQNLKGLSGFIFVNGGRHMHLVSVKGFEEMLEWTLNQPQFNLLGNNFYIVISTKGHLSNLIEAIYNLDGEKIKTVDNLILLRLSR